MTKTQNPEDSAEETAETEETKEKKSTISTADKPAEPQGAISPRAWRFMSKGAKDNPECENTAVVVELDGETMVFRIFRHRHTSEKNPLGEADDWIRQVKERCTSSDGEMKATAVWTDADGGASSSPSPGRRSSLSQNQMDVDEFNLTPVDSKQVIHPGTKESA